MSGHRRVCLGGESCCCLHPGTQRKRRAMCGLLIFKPSVCQVSAVGMRPRTHTPTLPQSLCLCPRGLLPAQRSFKLWSHDFFVYDPFGNEAGNDAVFSSTKQEVYPNWSHFWGHFLSLGVQYPNISRSSALEAVVGRLPPPFSSVSLRR